MNKLKILFNIKFALLLIVLLAGFLRFFSLGVNPPSLTWDEAAWGYNAYSLGIDGKDEFGKFLPVTNIESFGDFKPPLYAYLDILPVKILGLNEFATRFPSAMFGTLTVLITFFLVRSIFKTSKYRDSVAIFSSLFLALSPWHILLSRAAFEANVANFLIVFGIWTFLEAINKRKRLLILSAASFALSFYVFNTARIVSPLIVLLLLIVFRKQLFAIKKTTLLAVITGFMIFIPVLGFLLSPQAKLRFQEVNIFTDSLVVKTANAEISNDNNVFWSKIIHNRRVLYGISFIKHYFDNLSPNFLFITGDGNPKFSIQSVGQMYIFDIIFFAGGILYLFKKKEGYWWLIPVWILIAIIPAATARETPHSLRIESALPTFQILVAYGFVIFLTWVKKLDLRFKNYDLGKFSFVLILIPFVFLFFNFLYFYHSYFNNYPFDYSGEWQYGYKQSIDYVKSVEKDYDYIQITNVLGRPYIYYLFYTKTKPVDFRNSASIGRDPFGFVTVNSFGKYIFPTDYNYNLSKNKKVLYINTPFVLPKNIKILKTFYLLNGQSVLVAYTL
jgi:4-amino-4-deoxy-L-arabinose transferase-like glycosyltransferase